MSIPNLPSPPAGGVAGVSAWDRRRHRTSDLLGARWPQWTLHPYAGSADGIKTGVSSNWNSQKLKWWESRGFQMISDYFRWFKQDLCGDLVIWCINWYKLGIPWDPLQRPPDPTVIRRGPYRQPGHTCDELGQPASQVQRWALGR
jgi:hypothetical protein